MNASDHDLGTASVECDFAGDWNPSNTPAVPPLSPQLEHWKIRTRAAD
jgi:hypothetical protein